MDTFRRAPLKAKGEEATEKGIRIILLTYRTTPHPMLGGKSPAELPMRRMVQTINHTMLPKNKTNEIAKSNKDG